MRGAGADGVPHDRGREHRTVVAAQIEYRRWRGLVPVTALARYPIESPSLDELRALDPCFGLAEDAFVVEHADAARYFEIVRCRAHGRRFLRDTRGTVGWYTVLTLLRDDERGPPADIWRRYHSLDDGLLRLEGRSL